LNDENKMKADDYVGLSDRLDKNDGE